MSNVVKVKVSSEFPPAHAEWEVDIGAHDQTLEQQLAYTNLCYDIVAVGIGYLGIEFSKWITGNIDEEEFTKRMRAAREALL